MKFSLIFILFFSLICKAEFYYIDEPISDQTYLNFKNRVTNSSAERIERLVINSIGGDMFAAMAIGRLLQKNGIDIEVKDFCGSSCANYIFPSGKRKLLNETSLIGYHGGLLQENVFSQFEQLLKTGRNDIGTKFKEGFLSISISNPEVLHELGIPISKTKLSKSTYIYLLNYEKKFFEKLSVNQLITIYGQRGSYCSTYESKKYEGFYYSIEAMERFGLDNIELLSQSWKPENNKLAGTAYKIESLNENLLKKKKLLSCNVVGCCRFYFRGRLRFELKIYLR